MLASSYWWVRNNTNYWTILVKMSQRPVKLCVADWRYCFSIIDMSFSQCPSTDILNDNFHLHVYFQNFGILWPVFLHFIWIQPLIFFRAIDAKWGKGWKHRQFCTHAPERIQVSVQNLKCSWKFRASCQTEIPRESKFSTLFQDIFQTQILKH